MGVAVKKSTTLPDLSVRIMLSVLADAGLDPRPAFEAAGLGEGLSRLPEDISSTQEFKFQEAFVAITGYRPDLWFETGLRYHLPSFGPLGMALMTSMTLDDLSRTSLAGRPLDYSLASVHMFDDERGTRGRIIDTDMVPEAVREFSTYRDIGATLTVLRDVWVGDFPLKRIELAVPKPRRGTFSYRGQEIRFDAERTMIAWDDVYSRAKLYYGDPVLHDVYLQEIQTRADLDGSQDDLIDMLVALMARNGGVTPTLAILAAEAGQSERTLQRRLMQRGLKFREVADEARRRMALELLTVPDLRIAEIAWRLGYSETSSFNHAFKRWTGFSPALYRRGGMGRLQAFKP